MKRLLQILVATLALGMGLLSGLALADHSADGVNVLPVLALNEMPNTATNVQLPVEVSSQSLIDQAFVAPDAFDVDARDGTEHVPFMPGTGKTRILACWNESAVDETSDCNSAGSGDITLPTTGSAVFEFAADSQFRHLWVDVSTPAAGTDWACSWEYWNGSSYVELDNVTDATNCFQATGLKTVTFDFPANWPQSTLHTVDGYWVRVEIDAAAVATTSPLGSRVYYETGRAWVFEPEIGAGEQLSYSIHLDVPSSAGSASFSTSASDAQVVGTGAVYPPAYGSTATDGTIIQSQRSLAGATYVISNPIMRFDTSDIPDFATVTSADLVCTVRVLAGEDQDARDAAWEWHDWSVADGYHYEHLEQGNAHSGTDLSSFAADFTEHTFTLTSLYNVNRVGFTGLRGHISGAAPSGLNALQIASFDHATEQPCRLDVTWDSEKNAHLYFPHSDGYEIPDTAALEPGDTFSVKMGIHFAGEGVSSPVRALFAKDSDLQIRHSTTTAHRIFCFQNGLQTCNEAVNSSGYNIIELRQGGVDTADRLVLVINGEEVEVDTAASITDNASDWTFFTNGAGGAVEFVEYEINQGVRYIHQIRDIPDHQLDDHTGNGFDVVARYPDTVSGFQVAVQPLVPTVQAAPADEQFEIIGASPAITGYSESATGLTGTPVDGLLPFATASGLPFQAVTTFAALAITILAAVAAGLIFGEALVVGIVIIVCLVSAAVIGMLPWWMAPLFGLGPLAFFLLWKRAMA